MVRTEEQEVFTTQTDRPQGIFSDVVVCFGPATDRGYVANSLWEVAGFTEEGAIRFRQEEQEKTVDPQAMTEGRHIDLAYSGEVERLFRGNVNALFPNAP
jgi:hypothetical protein